MGQDLKNFLKESFKAYVEQYALSPDWRQKYEKKIKVFLIFLLILIVFMSIKHSFIVAAGLYFFVLLIGLMVLVLVVRALLNRSIWRLDKPGGFIMLITFVGVVGMTLLLAINVPNVISHLTQEDQYVAPTPQGFVPRLPGTPLPSSCTGASCSASQVFDEYCNSLMTKGAVEPSLYLTSMPSKYPLSNTKILGCSHYQDNCLSNDEAISIISIIYENEVTNRANDATFEVILVRGADGWKIEDQYLTPQPEPNRKGGCLWP